MTTLTRMTLDAASPEDTAEIAVRLARCLVPGDTILLSGGLGAGKTHFARALIQSRLAKAGLWEEVPSPTFTLVQTYSDGETEIWHADLYRVSGPDELIELGLDEAFSTAIVLIEWPDRLGAMAPPDALRIDLSNGPDDDARRLNLIGPADLWADRLSATFPDKVTS